MSHENILIPNYTNARGLRVEAPSPILLKGNAFDGTMKPIQEYMIGFTSLPYTYASSSELLSDPCLHGSPSKFITTNIL